MATLTESERRVMLSEAILEIAVDAVQRTQHAMRSLGISVEQPTASMPLGRTPLTLLRRMLDNAEFIRH